MPCLWRRWANCWAGKRASSTLRAPHAGRPIHLQTEFVAPQNLGELTIPDKRRVRFDDA